MKPDPSIKTLRNKMVVHAFGQISEFEASLKYKASSRTADLCEFKANLSTEIGSWTESKATEKFILNKQQLKYGLLGKFFLEVTLVLY